jgi:hypothetical protein
MSKRLNQEEIAKIKFLRSQGHSLPEISESLGVPKTTVFHHSRDVQILPEFVSEWTGKRGGSKKKKLRKEAEAFEEGKNVVSNLTIKERMLFICALYWAEGSKRDFGLSNTDPELIRTFIYGLRQIFHVSEDRFRVSIRIYEDLDREKCLDFWSDIVDIPKERFLRVDVLSGKKTGKLEYGMCRIRITRGADLLKKITGIYKAFASAETIAS